MFGLARLRKSLLTPVGAALVALGLLTVSLGPGGAGTASAAPDLTVTSSSVSEWAGVTMRYVAYVVNGGNQTAPASTLFVNFDHPTNTITPYPGPTITARDTTICSGPTSSIYTDEEIGAQFQRRAFACSIPSLPAGGSFNTIDLFEIATPRQAGWFLVTAIADARNVVSETDAISATRTAEDNNRRTTRFDLLMRPDLLTVLTGPTTAAVGATVTWTATVTNVGGSTAYVTDLLVSRGATYPGILALDFTGTAFPGATRGMTCKAAAKSQVSCSGATLGAGESVSVNITASVMQPICGLTTWQGPVNARANAQANAELVTANNSTFINFTITNTGLLAC